MENCCFCTFSEFFFPSLCVRVFDFLCFFPWCSQPHGIVYIYTVVIQGCSTPRAYACVYKSTKDPELLYAFSNGQILSWGTRATPTCPTTHSSWAYKYRELLFLNSAINPDTSPAGKGHSHDVTELVAAAARADIMAAAVREADLERLARIAAEKTATSARVRPLHTNNPHPLFVFPFSLPFCRSVCLSLS